MVVVAAATPEALAVSTISPLCPGRLRTMEMAFPLNAARSVEEKTTRLVGSPLAVATSSPGPLTENVIVLFARGTSRSFASSTRRVTNERS